MGGSPPEQERLRLEAALLVTRLGLWDWDIRTGAIEFSERWADIVGYSLEDLQPSTVATWERLAHPDDLARSDAACGAHLRGETPYYDVEVRMRHREGHWVWVHDRGRVVEWDGDGNAVRMIGTHEDITDRVQAQQALEESERRLASMFYDHEAVMLLVDPVDGRIVEANRAACEFYGYPGERLRQMRITDINMLPADEVARRYQQARDGRRRYFVFPHRLADGEIRMVDVHSSPISDHGRRLLFSIIRDVTEREVYETKLRQDAAVIDTISEAVLVTDADGVVQRVNAAFTAVTGWRAEDVLGTTAPIVPLPTGDTAPFRGELPVLRADGETAPSLVSRSPIFGPMGDIAGWVVLVSDLTERVRHEREQVDFAVGRDALTGLVNRTRFTELLGPALDRLRRTGRHAGLVVVDLDRFHAVNESYGNTAGDHVIETVAARLTHRRAPDDLVARLGGDEFGVLVTDVQDAMHAEAVALRLQRDIAAAITLPADDSGEHVEVYVSACLACTLLPGDGDADRVLQDAFDALHDAKGAGPGSIRRHRNGNGRAAGSRARLSMETRLRQAWERRELEVQFQPQRSVDYDLLIGAEALLRWTADGEPVPPGQFVPVAEDTDLIRPIGRWALTESCRQAVAWERAGLPRITVSVNVSARQFADGRLVDDVVEALHVTGLRSDRLALELTESVLFDGGTAMLAQLGQLDRLGVQLSIDDFGTGYASFDYLRRFPVHEIKIDRSFVRNIAEDTGDRALFSAIVALGRTMELRVLAEGVETPAQLEVLRQLRCDAYQGFLCSGAVPGAEIVSRYAAGHPARTLAAH